MMLGDISEVKNTGFFQRTRLQFPAPTYSHTLRRKRYFKNEKAGDPGVIAHALNPST